MKEVRVDKWLWAVRIFKSRSQANKACKTNKVKKEDEILKPSSKIEVGDTIQVYKNKYNYEFKVLKLLKKRVGYQIAKECYEDMTPEEELNKFESWYVGKGRSEIRDKGSGRPTKKERRELESFKFLDDDEDLED